MTGRILMLALLLCMVSFFAGAETTSLEERFAQPPEDTRILRIVHELPETAELRQKLYDRFETLGFGGLATNVAFKDYMADEGKWDAFVNGVKEAKERNFSLWLYDECGYPSGSAGGLTLEGHPEYEALGLHLHEFTGKDEAVKLEQPSGKLIRVLGMSDGSAPIDQESIVDLTALVKDGTLQWEEAPKPWRVIFCMEEVLYENTHAEVSYAFKLPYINLLCPEATARFLEVTHDSYTERLGKDLGKYFVSTFTDEPSLMSLFMKPSKHRVLPWSQTLAVQFEEKWGYPLQEALPSLLFHTTGTGGKYRHDFWKLIGDLVSENYFGQIRRWCEGHNILSGGHFLCEENFLATVPFYGNFFQCARELTAPGIDCLSSVPHEVPWFSARLFASVAELGNHRVTMSETSDHVQRYRPEGDTRPVYEVSEEEIRGTINLLTLNGINTITSYYSFQGLSDEELTRLNEWTGRCSTLIRESRQVSDIALLYPVESAWHRFLPARHWVNDSPVLAHRVERSYHDAEENLFRSHRDFIHVDNSVLEDCTVDSGSLVYGDLRWRVLILPDGDTLSMKAWDKLQRFYEEGGALIALVSRPTNSTEQFPDPRVQALGHAIFGEGESVRIQSNDAGGVGIFLPRGSEAMLPKMLNRLIPPEVVFHGEASELCLTHRRMGDRDLFFIINDSKIPWSGTMILPCAGEVERWDPATGTHDTQPANEAVSLSLEGYGGVFLLCENCPQPARQALEPGSYPGLQCDPLPLVTPIATHGECLEATCSQADNSEGESSPWILTGRITEDRVNTFLFAGFTFDEAVDLSGRDFLCFEAAIPEGQAVTVPLLVILIDEEGVEYLGETGIPMNGEGLHSCHVPLRRFRRAGWCTRVDTPLDFSRIKTMRIGWGGYYGPVDEVISFTVNSPGAG
ncbi:MAG: hypothetical protein GX130_12995 [Candidatus Hydrogenedens sp.]|nr:hypothetical protein [Candidatus Hydrogenedens sp.]